MILYVLKHGEAPVIDTVDFAVLSTEDVLTQSVVEVTETSLYTRGVPTTNGLNDLRMGTVDRRLRCSTCGESVNQCPGHMGHIRLPWPCYHIHFVETTLKALRCVCFFCSRVNLNESDIRSASRLKGKLRFTHVHNTCKSRKKCTHCGAHQPAFSRSATGIKCDWVATKFESEEEASYCMSAFTARHAKSILSCVPTDDLKLMGFMSSHPKDFIMEVVVVAPPVARPAVMASEGSRARGQDDLTLKLMDILRRCVEINQYSSSTGIVCPRVLDERDNVDEEMADKLSKLPLIFGCFCCIKPPPPPSQPRPPGLSRRAPRSPRRPAAPQLPARSPHPA